MPKTAILSPRKSIFIVDATKDKINEPSDLTKALEYYPARSFVLLTPEQRKNVLDSPKANMSTRYMDGAEYGVKFDLLLWDEVMGGKEFFLVTAYHLEQIIGLL